MEEDDENLLKPETAEEWLAAYAPPSYSEALALICDLPSIKKMIAIAEQNGTDIAYKGGLLVGFHIGANFVKTGRLEDV